MVNGIFMLLPYYGNRQELKVQLSRHSHILCHQLSTAVCFGYPNVRDVRFISLAITLSIVQNMTEEMQHSTETQSVAATRQTDQNAANIAPEVAKAKEGKREKCRPMTKIVIRRLPATMTQEQFLEQVSPLSEYDYMYFARADMSLGQYAFSRAYIDFVDPQDVFGFREKFDNYVFVDSKGTEFPAVVEYAPFQRVPKKRIGKKKDIKCATIESDPYYVNFLEGLKSQDTEAGNGQPKTEFSFQLVDHAAKKVTTTPLLDFLKQRKQEKQRLRDEKREEKRKRDLERKRSKDEPMISQVLKNVQDQDSNSRHVNKENKDDKERVVTRDLKNKSKKEDGWYSNRDQKTGKQVQVSRKNYRDGDDRVAVVQDREAKPNKKHKDENYRKKHDRDLHTKQDQSNEKNEIASCKERKMDEKRGKSYEKMRQEKKKLVEIRNKQDDDLDSLDDNGDEQDQESSKANENKSRNEQQDGKTNSRAVRKSSQMSDVTREEQDSTKDMLEEVCERLSQADKIEEKFCKNQSKPSPIKSLVKRRSSLESGADKNSASGSKTSASSGSNKKNATECLRRHKSLDGNGDDSNLQKSESDEKDKDKKTDPRVERRIRNKDRPAMEIYRPGMGKFSKKRMGQEKGEGSDEPVVTRSPSPPLASGNTISSSAKPGKDSASQVRTMTFKRSASREVP